MWLALFIIVATVAAVVAVLGRGAAALRRYAEADKPPDAHGHRNAA